MVLTICVLHMKRKRDTSFEELFSTLDSSIHVVVYTPREKNLLEKILQLQPDGILITGSERRIHRIQQNLLPERLLDLGIPVLGICYGFQWMTWRKGGINHTFEDKKLHEYEKYLEISAPFHISRRKYVFTHHDFIYELPASWKKVIDHEDQIWMAYESSTGHIGIQFHPEKLPASAHAFFPSWFSWLKIHSHKTKKMI